MKYMLDTNICIYIIKRNPIHVLKKFKTFSVGDVCLSSITVAELMYGVEKSQHREQNLKALEEFTIPLEIMPFDETAAHHYGMIRAPLEKKGMPIGVFDMMIAAHALSLNVVLVTHNTKGFSRISNLQFEDWA